MKKSITILVLSLLCGWARSQFPGGTGTPSDPYQVITPADLNYVRNFSGNSYSGTYFKLMNDIDLTSYLASGGDGYTLWGGAGWEPIGTFTDKFFGQFDGNNHNIGGLKINRGDSYIGLFGCVGNGGSIHNIGVEIDPAGAVTGYQYVGGLAGLNYGSISYCHTTGAVTGTSMLDGGLVGQNDGCITNCYATGAVTGSWSVGGLVGFNHGGTISNSYARGAVSGDQPGGLVGQNGSPIIGGTIINSYATGLVSGAYSGGLAGQYESNGTVTNSYWDTETTGQPTSAGGTGESTAGMKLQLTFTGWDFTAPVWIMNSGINNGYPYLSPPVQASAIVFSAVLSAGMTIGWTNGNETKRVVFIKHANTGTAIPANNTNYTADPNFGSGTQIGSTGWYCVYNSTGTSVAVTGLTAKTDYIVEVFEYIDPCGAKYNTSTATDNPKSQTTAAIEVTATAGTFGPTGYATLKAAFDAVNLGTHQDIITIKINSSTTETASAALNASGSGSAVYSAVIIYPTVTGLSISGAIDGPLVDLNGADYVTIDGRVGGTGSAKDLVIMNTSTSSATGNSTIRFISDASNNIVRYCTLKGSTLQGNSGVVCFQNNVGTNGNDLNTIEYNNITSSSDGARPTAAIASVLLTGSTAISDNNTISNNMIYDFLQPESNFSRGLNISQGASDWTITGNSFYETTSYSPTQNNPNYIIYVNSGANHTISSNSIGGSSPLCSGTWTKTASANNPFYGTGLTGSPYDAIKIANGVSNVTIDGFEIRNYAGSGSNGDGNAISSYCMSSNTTGASNVTIKNNYIHNLAYNGILAGSENDNGSTMVVQSGWLIQYNKLANFTYAGIELTNVINSQVYDNTIAAPTSLFSDPGDAGVGIEIAARSRLKAVTAGTNEVSRNTITGTFPVGSRAAINLLSRAYDDASANATLSNITVSGNSISGATNVRAAVLAVAESRSSHPSTISTLSITDNTLDGNLDELEIQDYINGGTGPATHSGITITGNDIKNSTGVGLHVMVSTTATGISATNNKIVSNALFGIKNEGSGTFAATSNYWGGCPKPKISGAATYYPYYTTCTGTAGSLVLGGLINNIVASASASPVCAGSSTTIYATGGSDYVWDNGLGSGATKVVTPTVNPTTYSVTATDAYGCTGAFASVSIAITPAPTVIITPSLDHTTLTASGATTYLWSTGATTAAITVSPSVFATYTVTGTTGTCTGTTSYTVAVANAGSNQYICNGSSANLNATLTGATATAYAWTPVTGLSNPAIQNPVASPTVTTTYTVSITATNGPYSASVTVFVKLTPTANAGPDITICSSGSGTLSGSATGGATPYAYAWTGPSSFTSTLPNPTVTLAGTYTLVVTGSNGCSSAADNAVVTIETLPTYAVTGNVSYYNTLNPQMHNVIITLKQGGATKYTAVTPASGNGDYSFPGVLPGTYDVVFSLPTAWGGVTTLDIVAIQKHYMPPQVYLTGLKRLAADVVDNSTDAIVVAADRDAVNNKRLNPTNPTYNFATGNWVFVKAADVLTNTTPFHYANSAGTSNIQITIVATAVTQDFKSLCYGDVDASNSCYKDLEGLDVTSTNGLQFGSYPNPFSGQTTLTYALPVDGDVEIAIYNILGRQVANISKPQQTENTYEVKWDATGLSKGVYIAVLTLRTGDDVLRQQIKMILNR